MKWHYFPMGESSFEILNFAIGLKNGLIGQLWVTNQNQQEFYSNPVVITAFFTAKPFSVKYIPSFSAIWTLPDCSHPHFVARIQL